MSNTEIEVVEIEVLANTPMAPMVEFGPDDDADTVEAAVGSGWRVDWATPAYKLASGRFRAPIFKQGTLVFGCSDKELDDAAWWKVFDALAAHLKATIGEDLRGDTWTDADEGCAITADLGRIEEIEKAIESFDGPVYVIAPVGDNVKIEINDEGYPVEAE